MLVPKAEELVATPYRFEGSREKARDFFEGGMVQACRQFYRYAREDVPVTIYYAYKQSESAGRPCFPPLLKQALPLQAHGQ